MEGIEEKIGAVLSNPEMMNTIMSMAKALGQNQSTQEPTPPPKQESPQKSAPPQQNTPPPLGLNELEMISR